VYDYEYEESILLALRLLSFLREDHPETFTTLIQEIEELNLDSAYELADLFLMGAGGFLDLGTADEEDSELSVLYISHPSINRFLTLNEACKTIGMVTHVEQVRKKFHDIVEFYATGLTSSVYGIDISFGAHTAHIRLILSPDYYSPLEFANSLIDMLLYIRQENQRLEGLLEESKATEPVFELAEQEAA
jgi:hypothetical protein